MTHLNNMLSWALLNGETLAKDVPHDQKLRAIARHLHCSSTGVRARLAADMGQNHLVLDFLQETMWKDLLTGAQKQKGDIKYQKLAATKLEYAQKAAWAPGSGSGASSELNTSPAPPGELPAPGGATIISGAGSEVNTSLAPPEALPAKGGAILTFYAHAPPWRIFGKAFSSDNYGDGPPQLRGGGHILREWSQHVLEGTAVAHCMIMHDYNDVINSCGNWEAIELGTGMEHLSGAHSNIPWVICSYGRWQSLECYNVDNPWYPAVVETDGQVFTDFPVLRGTRCDVYRPINYPQSAIRIRGDKSCVSALLNMPTLLFDDKEDRIDNHATGHPQNEGIVVKRGRKRHDPRYAGYRYLDSVDTWIDASADFAARHGPVAAHVGAMNPYGGEGPGGFGAFRFPSQGPGP